jgi:hypothetical protein
MGFSLLGMMTGVSLVNGRSVRQMRRRLSSVFVAQSQDFFDPAFQPKTVPITDLFNRLNGV